MSPNSNTYSCVRGLKVVICETSSEYDQLDLYWLAQCLSRHFSSNRQWAASDVLGFISLDLGSLWGLQFLRLIDIDGIALRYSAFPFVHCIAIQKCISVNKPSIQIISAVTRLIFSNFVFHFRSGFKTSMVNIKVQCWKRYLRLCFTKDRKFPMHHYLDNNNLNKFNWQGSMLSNIIFLASQLWS